MGFTHEEIDAINKREEEARKDYEKIIETEDLPGMLKTALEAIKVPESKFSIPESEEYNERKAFLCKEGYWIKPRTISYTTEFLKYDEPFHKFKPLTPAIIAEFINYGLKDLARMEHNEVFTALFGMATLSGITSHEAFPLDNQILVTKGASTAGPTGLNLCKLKAVKELIEPIGPIKDPILVISPNQYHDMRHSSQELQELVNGLFEIEVKIIISSQLPLDGNGYRRCIFFLKESIAKHTWHDTEYQLRRQPHVLYNHAIMTISKTFGYTRVYPKGCYEIKCAEA